MIQGTVKINVTADTADQAKKLGGGLQDLANLVRDNHVDVNDAIKLLSKVREKPSLVKKALKFI